MIACRPDGAVGVTALRSQDVERAVEAFEGGVCQATATAKLDADGVRHAISREVVETSVLDHALHQIGFICEDYLQEEGKACVVDRDWGAVEEYLQQSLYEDRSPSQPVL